MEITIKQGNETQKFLLSSATAVESQIPAKKIKTGSRIYLSRGGGGRASGRKGFKSPFSGIPKGMRKSLGLPDIPGIPDIPGKPDLGPELPQMPKIPKIPKIKNSKKEGRAAAPEEDQGQGKPQLGQKTQPPPAPEPRAEEKTLFGKADSAKPLLKSTGAAAQSLDPGKKVLKAEITDSGVKLQLQGPDGKSQEVVLQPDKTVMQALSISELRKDMNIQVKTEESSQTQSRLALKVIVIE